MTGEKKGRSRRIRKIDPANLWRLVLLRGLGLSQKDIAIQLGVQQEAVSYQLKRLRRMILEEEMSEYDLFLDLVLESERGTQIVSQGIVQKLYENYEQRMFKSRRG